MKELPSKKWVIYDFLTQTNVKPDPNATYTFVTMPDKSIRIAVGAQGVHSSLSGLAPYICYAGEIQFDEQQQIKSWNNQSGSYQPPAFHSFQAGFGRAKGFYSVQSCEVAENISKNQAFPKKLAFGG